MFGPSTHIENASHRKKDIPNELEITDMIFKSVTDFHAASHAIADNEADRIDEAAHHLVIVASYLRGIASPLGSSDAIAEYLDVLSVGVVAAGMVNDETADQEGVDKTFLFRAALLRIIKTDHEVRMSHITGTVAGLLGVGANALMFGETYGGARASVA